MNYKKIILPILFFVLFLGFNTNVYAKTEVGFCDYLNVDTSYPDNNYGFRITIYDNSDVKFTSKNTKNISYPDLKKYSTEKNTMVNNGTCYRYVGANKKDKNIKFTDNLNDISGYAYKFEVVAEDDDLTCSYDLRVPNYDESKIYYVRYTVEKKASSYTYSHSVLQTMGSNKTVSANKESSIQMIAGEKNGGIVTYNFQDSALATIVPSNEWFSSENMGKGKCPTITYNVRYDTDTSGNGRPQINIYGLYENFGRKYDVSSSSSYKTLNVGEITKENDEKSGSSEDKDVKKCHYNGTTTVNQSDLAKNTYQFSFNLTFKISNTIYENNHHEMCVQISGGEECANPEYGVNIFTNTGNFSTELIFLLDDNLGKWFRTSEYDSFECPKEVYLYNAGGVYGQYYFTTDASKGAKMNNGSIDEPTTIMQNEVDKAKGSANAGTPVSGCEILGTEFYNYIASAFMWIQILGPILALVLSMVDMFQAIASGEEDAKKKALKSTKTRIISAILLILVPFIIKVILMLVDNINGTTCNL